MTLRQDTRIFPLALRLAECLCGELAEAGGPETCFCGVLAGDTVTMDYCSPCGGGRCGMAWVRIASVLPLAAVGFNVNFAVSEKCAPALAGVFEVGVLRCAPTFAPGGELPSLADQLAAAELQASDMGAAGRAASCCFAKDGRFVTVGSWNPIGPVGDCLGGAWTVTVGEY